MVARPDPPAQQQAPRQAWSHPGSRPTPRLGQGCAIVVVQGAPQHRSSGARAGRAGGVVRAGENLRTMMTVKVTLMIATIEPTTATATTPTSSMSVAALCSAGTGSRGLLAQVRWGPESLDQSFFFRGQTLLKRHGFKTSRGPHRG